jgi:hypothetical protein
VTEEDLIRKEEITMSREFKYDREEVDRRGMVFKLLFTIFFIVFLGVSVNTQAQTQWPKYISLSSSAGTQWTVAVGMSAQIQKYIGVGSSALGPT